MRLYNFSLFMIGYYDFVPSFLFFLNFLSGWLILFELLSEFGFIGFKINYGFENALEIDIMCFFFII
jgi:hypothetical protein